MGTLVSNSAESTLRPTVSVVSVHLPKTAGSSMGHLLRELYGEGYSPCYDDKPLHRPRFLTRAAAQLAGKHASEAVNAAVANPYCLHGHVLPHKFRRLQSAGAKFVTWLRDPVARLQSHFDYWQREFDPKTAGRLHRKMLREGWDFERFALGPELRNVYGFFMWRFPLSQFDFVGLVEEQERDLPRLKRLLTGSDHYDQAWSLPTLNQRREPPASITPALRSAIERWHAHDVALYRQAQEQGARR